MLCRNLVFFALASALCGCGRGNEYIVPPVHPVKGQVVRKGNPVKGGSLSFQRVNEQNPLIVNGLVDEMGHFELASLQDRKRIPGAPVGEYQVIYSPPVLGKDALPVTLGRTVEIKAGANELMIDLGAGD